MRSTIITATLAGGISSMAVAEEASCTKPIASHDTVPTKIIQRALSKAVDNAHYWQAMTRYVLEDSNGDIKLATEHLTQQLRGSFHNSLPPTASFWRKLLKHSLSDVDWHEIAEQLIADFNKTTDSDRTARR